MTGGRDVLWSATLGGAELPERVEAAAVNQFRGLTVRPDDLEGMSAGPRSLGSVLARARDGGVDNLVLEGLSSWYDHEAPRVPFPSDRYTIDDHLRAAERFGSIECNIVAPFRTAETVESLTDRFARVCDRFARVGVNVHLEFTPFPPIASLATAWEIVRGADRGNGGIVVDTWHFFRGQPDLELLASIPGDRIFAVQVNDGAEALEESLAKDTYRHRRLPGDGTFDLIGVLRTLRRTGGLRLVGPEVLSVDFDGVPPTEVARRVGTAIDRVMAALDAPD